MESPRSIKRLEESVVNRIAAGEIIQRPFNALKELLENSLDAKANQIQVTVKAGGLKFLQIQDNGTGIRKEDLGIVCERFTTSKLSCFEDLGKISTYGFRGEALASITHVAHLTIQTKTAKEKCAYKASYEDGKLKGPPKPCAGNQGTIITIEDLFYNMPQRRQVLKSANEEFNKVSEVMAKYAIHNSNVGFLLKKYGEQPTLKLPPKSTPEMNIGIVYGEMVSKELLPIVHENSTAPKFQMKGFITKVNYTAKRSVMLLFINHRLVESAAIKTAIDNVYSVYLPKGTFPFVYLSLEMNPRCIDVNVHPTKHEVHFLYEDEIVDKVKGVIEAELLDSNSTRIFYKQMKLPGVVSKDETDKEKDKDKDLSMDIDQKHSKTIYAKDMIRTDHKEQKLDKFIKMEPIEVIGCNLSKKDIKDNSCEDTKLNITQSLSCSSSASSSSSILMTSNKESRKHKMRNESKSIKLTSVLNACNKIEKNCSTNLRKILKDLVFVGVIDKNFALFQYETKLYMTDTIRLSEELFYQRLYYQFGNLPVISVKPEKVSIKDLLMLALNSPESGWTEEDGDREELAKQASDILQRNSIMLKEYFSLHFTETGELEALPALLENHRPSITHLPIYLLRLATEVEWETEVDCFETFCRETANYYARIAQVELNANPQLHKWTVEHVLFPAFKKYLLPSEILNEVIYELTNLPTLYKVFERC